MTADFLAHEFDYIIVGGGTAGLVVAARLSENPALTVGVIEAGPTVAALDNVDIPGLYGQTLGTDLDWQFETTPQAGLGGRTLAWPRGKVLGGTSALNFMTWNRACKEDYDAWRDLGNAGWGWDDLLPFFKKTETFQQPGEENQKKNSLFYDNEAIGHSGPVRVGYASEYSPSHQHWHQTLAALGVSTNRAHMAGSNIGAWTNLGSVDSETGRRSYSTTAYYLPNASRPNLVLLTDAQVTEIVLEKEDEVWRAAGVTFRRDAIAHFVPVSREVVVSAGTVQSPQLLELSGIGDAAILAEAGITAKVRNPSVGENLQDHIMAAMIFEVDSTLPTPDDVKQDHAALASAREQFVASRTGPLTILANSICYLPFSHLVLPTELKGFAKTVASITAIPKLERTIRQRRFDASSSAQSGQIEYIFDLGNWSPFFRPAYSAGIKYATCLQILQHPFSKGCVHTKPQGSNSNKPIIDPQYYSGPYGGPLDLTLMIHAARFAAGRIAQTLPLASIIRRRVFPPPQPNAAEDDEEYWRNWLIRTTITDWHPVGTCAMGSVVDERLRVHGVKGLRVVDASVMPLQISAHLQATVYAIGEKGAAMILKDAGLQAGSK